MGAAFHNLQGDNRLSFLLAQQVPLFFIYHFSLTDLFVVVVVFFNFFNF
jgi:hypothetical protein